MFTGLVEEIGVVSKLDSQDSTGGTSLTISLPPSSTLLSDAQLGDSISINGVCLTATSLEDGRSFRVGIAPETLRLTNLGALSEGDRVNLERAVRADARMGGHFVQGHVDTVATITKVEKDGNALTFRFAPRPAAPPPPTDSDNSNDESGSGSGSSEGIDVLRYIVFKGYVALDGTSLTVTRVDDAAGWWEVMLIAYTQDKVALAGKRVGDTVNVEVDVLAKYAEKSMAGYLKMGAQSDALLKPVVENMVQSMVQQGMGGHPT